MVNKFLCLKCKFNNKKSKLKLIKKHFKKWISKFKVLLYNLNQLVNHKSVISFKLNLFLPNSTLIYKDYRQAQNHSYHKFIKNRT